MIPHGFGACAGRQAKAVKRRSKLRIVAVLVMLTACSRSLNRDSQVETIDAFMKPLSARGQFSGAVIAGKGDDVVYARGFGFANVGQGIAFTPDTPTDGASMAKTLSSAAIFMLQSEGRLKLDNPARTYLPELPYPEITVRHLITHGTGLPHRTNVARAPLEGETRTREWLLKTLAENPPPLAFEPGSDFQYSGPGFDLASLIVERVTGMSYDAFLNERFFRPLKMSSTFLRPAWLDDWKGVRTLSYRKNGDKLKVFEIEDNRAFHGRGNIYWSARDLYKWSASFYAHPILDPSILASGLEPPIYGERRRSTINHLSWHYADEGRRYYYTGHTRGFYTFVYWDADSKHSVVYVSNNMPMWLRPSLARALIQVMEGRDPEPIDAPDYLELHAETLETITGEYEINSLGRVTITLDGEELHVHFADGIRREMFPVEESFYIPAFDAWVGFTGRENQMTLHWDTVFGGLLVGERVARQHHGREQPSSHQPDEH